MKNKSIFILATCIFFLSLIPIAYTYFQTKDLWQGVVPSFVDDDLYYYARMQNIMHGYPLIGNPYFFEHRQEISPAFFASDWIAVIPMKISLPLSGAVAINFIFWSIVFSVLIYYLFKQYHLSERVSIVGSVLTYMTLYTLILRPVSMQIVAPFFLLFLIVYGIWLKSEKPSKLQNVILAISVGASFYIYTYLSQIVLAILGVTFLFLIYKKNWQKLKNFFVVCIISIFSGLPAILYTLKQVSSPNYWDTMSRIGLVNTHLPTLLSFYDGFIIFIFLIFGYLSVLWVKDIKDDSSFVDTVRFVTFTGLGLFIALFSNVVTGKELEISNHIERFIVIWVPITFILYLWFIIKHHLNFKNLQFYKKIILFFVFILSFIFFMFFLIRGFGISNILSRDSISSQEFAKPLDWLDENAPKESVIWSNGDIGYYLPIETTHFSLFNGFGMLHLLSTQESEERYLVSNYFSNLTLEDIKKDFRQYAGAGNSIHQYKTFNRKVRICQLLRLSFFGADCGVVTDAISFKGEGYFVSLYDEYNKNIKPNIKEELGKFKVGYIVKDKKIIDNFTPKNILKTSLVYEDDRFEIYRLNY